nr:hypothetical protein [Siminovitchia terrae]
MKTNLPMLQKIVNHEQFFLQGILRQILLINIIYRLTRNDIRRKNHE